MTVLAKALYVPKWPRVTAGGVSVFALVLSVLIGLSAGAFEIHVADILAGNLSAQQEAVLWSIRLPRVLLAGLVGAGLAICGAVLQGLFRNPLADPQLIGVSAGAALAVALTIVLGTALHFSVLPDFVIVSMKSIAAFFGGLFTCLVIFKIARISGKVSVAHMLLAGIAVSAIAFSGIGFLSYLSDDQQLREITFWTLGSFGSATWSSVVLSLLVIVPCGFFLTRQGQALNILQLGEDECRYLGVDSEKLKNILVMLVALCIGVCVSVSGIIGFVGLVVPHLIRLSTGADHRVLLPLSAAFGAVLLIIADTLARTLVTPAEMPVGILTALIGGPYFLWLLTRQYQRGF